MMKMWVAISQRSLKSDKGTDMDVLERSYVEYFSGFDIGLVPIPNACADIGGYFSELPVEAVILSGGNDVDPGLYGQKPVYVKDVSPSRDDTEKKLLELAIKKNLPVLGICRGMQFINVFFGGGLIQDLAEDRVSEVGHVIDKHGVDIIDDELARLIGKRVFDVNSFHNQGVTRGTLSTELKAFAVSPKDGVIEGFHHVSLPIAGIQWHPERPGSDKIFDKRLLEAFINRRLYWRT
ncbi:MAG: hypothetical protein B6U72_07225 [Candidatus Altiarchaeales archaeon ex4484_2]|nr:MAG: hypothetical protein B6U72_07225 [Candidatus Altiarchaeales archaeon ex4484_2]